LSTEPHDFDPAKLQKLLQQRDEQRAQGAELSENLAERLARDLLGEGLPRLTCADVQAQLPE